MDNKAIANIFYETADLMEINGDDSFRIRSYRRAAEALEGLAEQVSALLDEPKKLLEIPGIGKGMAANIQELCREWQARAHIRNCCKKYRPTMLELLKIQGLGPKTIALLWSAFQVSDLAGVEKLAREGKLRELPRLSEKSEQKILKAIENYRRITGRFLLDEADRTAQKLTEHLKHIKGIEKITPAGSLRRGRETVGDLDMLITGPCCVDDQQRGELIEEILRFPGILRGAGQRRQQGQLQIAQRNAGGRAHVAAGVLWRGHAVLHRLEEPQRHAAPARAEDGLHAQRVWTVSPRQQQARGRRDGRRNLRQAQAGHAFLPSCARIAAKSKPPRSTNCLTLITVKDIRGEVHMHTVETDGKCTIDEMAEAAKERGYQVHRDHRPLEESGFRQRPGRQTRRAAHRAHSGRQ